MNIVLIWKEQDSLCSVFERNNNETWQRLTCIHEMFGTGEPTFFIKKVISQISILQKMHLPEHLEATEKYIFIVINYNDSLEGKRPFYEKQRVSKRNTFLAM